MKHTQKPLILLLGVLLANLLAASCSPPLTEADMTLTQAALVSPTSTTTSTPRPSSTATLTPTNTPPPTPTPLPYYVSTQRDGSTLVTNGTYGFQFELPEGWTYRQPRADGDLGFGRYNNGSGTEATLDPATVDTTLSLERHLNYRVNWASIFNSTIHSQAVTTNQHGVTLGYFHSTGYPITGGGSPIRWYFIYFESRGVMIEFHFEEDVHLVLDDIAHIQESIQLIDG